MIELPDTELRSNQRLDLIMPEEEAVNPLADLNALGIGDRARRGAAASRSVANLV